jgi:UDP-glucose 4-epimerase
MSRMHGGHVLVTGGAGFVGSNLLQLLLAHGCERIVVVDNLLSSERANVPDDPRIRFVEGSIADDGILSSLTDSFSYVFHLATYHGNQSSIADPLADHEHNLLPTLKLFERIKKFRQLHKLVYAASGCTLAPHTFEDVRATAEDGAVPFDLDSPYQISKVVGEFYSVYYHRRHELPTVRARFQNVYGPGEVLGAGRWRGTPATVWRNVTPTFIYRALKQQPLEVQNEGKASRDFIYVEDIVRGLLLCATDGEPGDVYNLASGVETSIRDLAVRINTMTDNPSPIEVLPRRDWDHAGRRFGSTEKAKRGLGFEAQVGLDDGLRRTIDWSRQNLGFIDACIHKHEMHMRAAEFSAGRRMG